MKKTQPRSKEVAKKCFPREIHESMKKVIKDFYPQTVSCRFYIEVRTDKNGKIHFIRLGSSKIIDDIPDS